MLLDNYVKTSYDRSGSNIYMSFYSKFIKLISPLIYLASPALAFAQTPVNPCPPDATGFAQLCKIAGAGAGFGPFIGNLVTAAIVLSALVSLAFLIYGGVKWIMSEGDKTAVENARQTIVGAVVGLVIVFVSYLILSIVLKVFGITLTNLVIPNATIVP